MTLIEVIEWLEANEWLEPAAATKILQQAGIRIPRTEMEREK